MKYRCNFVHPKTRERRTIVIELDNEFEQQPAVIAEACALQHAYRDMPRGFLHDQVERVQLHRGIRNMPPVSRQLRVRTWRPTRMGARIVWGRHETPIHPGKRAPPN